MQVRCPECKETLGIDQLDHPTEISCDSCGGKFSLISDEKTIGFLPGQESEVEQTSIAHFRLIRRLGAGAFGVVWEAKDEKLDRTVAIKVPRGGSAGDIQFLREAQAAAQLRHPNIVSIHEVGLHGEAIYIVSDFIDGVPLSELLSERRFDSRQAAELCEVLAGALEHAHEEGVVHRDLKPANIMMEGSKPYIMDFGLAKRNLAEVTMTIDGKIMGTPAYMSPEQARGEANTVDGRSDVYSLGVILFQLLTGELPFRGNLRMLIEQVIHDDPPALRKLNGNVPRDLETICLKCLRKSPERARYDSAADLATDLRRWINREPIAARPFTKPERFVRWCQRRPLVAALAAMVVFVTALGFAGVTWQWRKSEVLRVEAEANFQESERQREKRDANFETALTAVDKMLTYIGEKSLAEVPRMQRVRRDMLEDAAQFYIGFVSEKSDDPDILVESARSYIRVADIRQSLDEQAECEVAYNKAIEILEGLNDAHPERQDVQENLASAFYSRSVFHSRDNRIQEAIRDVESAIEIRESLSKTPKDSEPNRVQLAMLLGQHGSYRAKTSALKEGESEMRKALSMFSKLGDSEEKRWREASLRLGLAILHVEKTMQIEDAESMVTAAINSMEELVEEKPWNRDYRTQLANCKRLLAVLLLNLNRSDDAETEFVEHVAVWKQLVDDYPHIPEYQNHYAGAISDLAILYARSGRLPDAQEKLKESIEIQERLVSEVPLPGYRRQLSTDCTNLGAMLINSGAPVDAEPYMRLALEMRQRLMNESPDVELYKHQVNISAANLANAIMLAEKETFGEVSSERLEEADGLLALAIDIGNPLIQVENSNPIYRHKQAIAFRIRGALWVDKDTEKSCEALRESIQLVRGLKDEIPQDLRFAHQLHYSLDQLAESLLMLERFEEAEQAAREANELVKNLAETTGNFQFRTDYAVNTRKLGELLEEIGDDLQARDAYSRAIEMSTAILEEQEDNPASREQLAHAHDALAFLLATSSNADVRQAETAVDHAGKAVSLKDDALCNGTLGITLYAAGKWEEAVEAFEKARQLRLQIDATANMYHAMALSQLGFGDEALDVFNAAIAAAEAGDTEFPESELQAEAYSMLN